MLHVDLNDYVWVELNENGWKHLESYYKKLFGSDWFTESGHSVSEYMEIYKKNTAPHTIEGVERMLTRFQLHDFMFHFGNKMYPGAKQVLETNNLYFGLET